MNTEQREIDAPILEDIIERKSPFTGAPCLWRSLKWWRENEHISIASVEIAASEGVVEFYNPYNQRHYCIKMQPDQRGNYSPEFLAEAQKLINEHEEALQRLIDSK